MFFIVVLTLSSSFNTTYKHPEYYEVNFNDGVTHLWSREVYFDYYGTIEEITNEVYLKYDKMTIDSLTFFWSRQNYHNSRDALHKEIDRNTDSIMKRVPFNLKLTLDKYCSIH